MPVNFVKNEWADITLDSNRDIIIPGVVELTRAQAGPIINLPGLVNIHGNFTLNSQDKTKVADEPAFQNGKSLYGLFWGTPYDTTPGVKWGLENFDNFPNTQSNFNSSLLADTITNSNFFTFSELAVLVSIFSRANFKPTSFNVGYTTLSKSFNGGTYAAWVVDLVNINLIMYIESSKTYLKFKITNWGQNRGNGGALSYTREIYPLTSNICFKAGTIVSTDQGNIPIEQLKPDTNTINNKPIQYITKTFSADPKLVMVKKHALSKNVPNKDTIMSGFHKIQFNDSLIEAYKLSYINKDIVLVDNTNEPLYNILMENHEIISVQNMSVESLHPENIIAKLYKSNLPQDKKNKLIEEISIATKTEDYEKYNLIKNHIL